MRACGGALRSSIVLGCLLSRLDRVSCQATSTNLLEGQYITTFDVQSELNLTLDIRDMREVEDGTGGADEDRQRDIYTKGENSRTRDADGNEVLRSLASLSLKANEVMAEDFMYNIYRRSFYNLGVRVEEETPGDFDDRPSSEYANTIVNDLFKLDLPGIETDATLVLGVWMAVAHELWEVAMACGRNDGNTSSDMALSIDRAAALWIGDGQLRGDDERGNMLYNLAQKAGQLFNKGEDSSVNEVEANEVIIGSLKILQSHASDNTCGSGESGYLKVRKIVMSLYAQMTVPLIQLLIHHIRVQPSENLANPKDFIELYALAVMPQVSFCKPAEHDEMVDMFITGTMELNDRDQAVKLVQSVYGCMHISCEMIGSYLDGEVPQCSDKPPETPAKYAGYQSESDATQYSYIDRDVTLFRVFLEEQAYGMAKDLYNYGYNSRPEGDILALQEVATFLGRDVVPQMDVFNDYFDSEGENGFIYADTIIEKVLNRQGPYEALSPFILTEIGVGAVQYMVMYMAVLQKMYVAISRCKNNNEDDALKEWDQAVAMFVGSMEGEEVGGSKDSYGMLLYEAGKFYCDVFDTCVNNSVNSKMNVDIMQSFEDGQDAILDGACDDLALMMSFIEQDLVVPLIQGTIHFAVVNEPLTDDSRDASLGIGHIVAQSIIPLIDDLDETSATLIDSNTNILYGVPNAQISEVFDGFRNTIAEGLNVDCDVLGIYANYANSNVCDHSNTTPPGEGGNPPPSPSSNGTVGFGRYSFNSPENALSKIAFDIRDMAGSNPTEALRIYSQGQNAIVEADGEPGLLTLEDFSTGADDIMYHDPMFNIFKFALKDEGEFVERQSGGSKQDATYADTTVREALEKELVDLAAKAAVSLNVWMMIANSLYQSVRDCQDGISDTFRIDNAVALWIGEHQQEGNSSGWLMYALAETSARRFGTFDSEVPVNTALIGMFNDANSLMKSCTNSSSTFMDLRTLVSEMLPIMTIPLLEELLYHIDTGGANGNLVKLYSVAVVPQMAGCDPAAFSYLKGVLLDEDYVSFGTSNGSGVFRNLKPLLRCLRLSCDDLQLPKESDGSYISPFNELCDDGSPKAIAGYAPSSDVSEYSRIDLDLLHINIFMENLAYEAAVDFYINGYNSKPDGELLSFQSLANDPGRTAAKTEFPLYSKFFGDSEDYADQMIMDGFDTSGGAFEGASPVQAAELVGGTIQTVVLYMAVLQRLFVAVDECEDGVGDAGAIAWDSAVALFVGSIEGEERGGSNGGGQLLFALGSEMCDAFSTCETSGSAAVNERLMDSFASGKSLLEQGDCANMLALVTENMLPVLPIPMIQGTLDYASLNAGLELGSPSAGLASGHVLAFSILPLVNDANVDSARTIGENMEFQLSEKPVKDGVAAVYNAFSNALSGMGISCADIGISKNHSELSVCQGNNSSPTPKPPSTPTNLSEGLYTTTTNVQDRANIAQDVADMEKHLRNGNVNVAKFIYSTGANSQIFNENGVVTGQRSLSAFSTSAPTEMKHEPLFNMFKFALQDSKGKYLGKDAGVYADTIVLNALGDVRAAGRTLASEAVVVLNLWMYIVHELYQTLDQCRRKNIADADGIQSIDEVAAYWIGDGQKGDSEEGHLMYALTEKYGDLFNVEVDGQAKANTNILKLLNQAKLELTTPNSCTDDPKTFPRLFQIVNKIIPQMLVPLIQGLLYNLKLNDHERVKLYAQSFLPLVAATNPDTYEFLSDKLISQTYNVVDMEAIMDAVHSTLPGFNLKCEDVGVYSLDNSYACREPVDLAPLAGYRPETNVEQYAKIDLDIRELDILMRMEAYEAARDLYQYGKHVVVEQSNGEETLTLFDLSISSDRLQVPSFKSFERYFNDDRYANALVQKGFETDSTMSPEQRTEIVVKSSQYLVVYMSALSAFYESLAGCRSDAPDKFSQAANAWDKAAAMLIGSMEGTLDGGSDHGQLHHGLAKKRCTQFGTCQREPRNAQVNERMVELFYAGRAELSAKSCDTLEKGIENIESLLLVPLIQSTLRYAAANTNINLFSRDGNVAEGYVFSRSILPLVEDANRDAAAVLEKAMDLSATKDDRDAAAVFDALAQAYDAMGVDCTLVGSTSDGGSACEGSGGMSSGSGVSGGAIAGAVIGSIVAVALGVFVFKRYQSQRLERGEAETTSLVTNELGILDTDKSGLEHSPRVSLVERVRENSFARNESGVMNHVSEGGLGEHFETIDHPALDSKDGLV